MQEGLNVYRVFTALKAGRFCTSLAVVGSQEVMISVARKSSK